MKILKAEISLKDFQSTGVDLIWFFYFFFKTNLFLDERLFCSLILMFHLNYHKSIIQTLCLSTCPTNHPPLYLY